MSPGLLPPSTRETLRWPRDKEWVRLTDRDGDAHIRRGEVPADGGRVLVAEPALSRRLRDDRLRFRETAI